MQPIYNFLNSIPPSVYQVALASGILSPVLQAISHFINIQSKKTMFVLVTIASFLVALWAYLRSTFPQNPWILAAHTAYIAFGTQPFYFFLVRPLYKRITDGTPLATEAKSAIVPAGGLPSSQPSSPIGPAATATTPLDIPIPDRFDK